MLELLDEVKPKIHELELFKKLSELNNQSIRETTRYTHSIHPYPAKYIPQIPNLIIEEFTNERHTVLDPFCGCGTTLLEAKLLGRRSVGIDLNPIGVLISRVKTYSISDEDLLVLEQFKNDLKKAFARKANKRLWKPNIPKIDHWFCSESIEGLSKIVDVIRKVSEIDRRRILNLALSGIIVNVSNQESETRFAAISKEITLDKILNSYLTKLNDIIKKLLTLKEVNKFAKTDSKVILENTLSIGKILNPNSIDLIVTSPPYLNSFDYYLYHKFRIYWLSYPENMLEVIAVDKIQDEEIGSRYKYSGKNSSNVSEFKDEMRSCFSSLNTILKPSKLLFLVVGDSIVKGDFMKMDVFYEELINECGFKFLSKLSCPMRSASRSFVSANVNNKHYAQKESHILAFESVNILKKNGANRLNAVHHDNTFTSNELKPIEVEELPENTGLGANYYIKSNSVTDYTHGLVKYPAKYIPQIPRWAIKKYSKPGDLVLDPFNGSGTTSLECLTNKISFIGIDVNPLAILTSDVKTKYITSNRILKEIEKLKKEISKIRKKKGSIEMVAFDLKEFWFNDKVLKDLFLIKSAIDKVVDADVKKLMLASLSSIIKKVSFLDEGQLKVKRDAKKVINGTWNVEEIYFKRLSKDSELIESIKPFSKSKLKNIHKIGSAYDLKSFVKNNSVDLIVTSPPYINAMNYPMYHRYELLILGLIKPEEYIEHQTKYIGTERVYSRDYKQFTPFMKGSDRFIELNNKLKTIYEREAKRYFITKKYFDDMDKFLVQSYQVLKDGCKLVIVCGTNTIKSVPINTSFELSKIGQAIGFKEVTYFSYEIRKHRFKLTRHQTAGKINTDIIIVLEK